MITHYLLNYFPGIDIERRNCHGFTAMMKAAMQGRAECVRYLMMTGTVSSAEKLIQIPNLVHAYIMILFYVPSSGHSFSYTRPFVSLCAGGDIEARDFGRKLTPQEWALFTGRYETVKLISRLMEKPCAEQFCDSYHMGWPMLSEMVARSKEPKSCWRKFSECICNMFNISMKTNPVDEGVMDYTVRMTTALASPLVATACHTVCPGSPPCVGKRRPAVQDILRRQRLAELKNLGPERLNNYKRLFQNSRVLLVPKKQERRASLQPQLLHSVAMASTVALRRNSLLPLHMMRRSSVRPGTVVPKVLLCKAPPPIYMPERPPRRGSKDSSQLQIPKWKYKALKEEKKKAEQMERLRLPIGRKK